MAKPLFDDTAIKAQIDKVERETPAQQVSVGAVAENGDVGVVAQGELSKGGVFVGGQASWMTRAGYRAAVFFGWRGKDAR